MSLSNNPKVSVIIPAHNVEHYISSCVNSVINGAYKNIELLLVENGSDDKTPYICDEEAKKDSRIRVFHISSQGVSNARNFGIEESCGKYVCFVDADDLVSASYVEYLVKAMERWNVTVGVALPVVAFKNKEDILYWKEGQQHDDFIGSSDDALEQILLYKTAIGCFSKMFKREFLIKKEVQFINDLFVGEGFNFNVKAFNSAEKVFMTTKQLYFYRISNPNSAMTKVDIRKLKNGLSAIGYLNKTLNVRSRRIDRAFKYAKWHTNFDFLMIMLAGHIRQEDCSLFKLLDSESRKGMSVAKMVPISFKEKVKAFGATLNPTIAGRIFNKLRKRRFSI